MLKIFEVVGDNRLITPQMTIVGSKKAPLANKSGAKIDKQATLKAGRLRKFETSAGAVGKAQKTLRNATATKEQRDRAKATIKRAAEKMRSGGSGIPFEQLHPRYPKGSPGGKGGKFMPKGSAEYKATVANNLAVEVVSGKATLSEARQAAKEAGITKKPELGEELGAMFKEADRIGKKYQDEPETIATLEKDPKYASLKKKVDAFLLSGAHSDSNKWTREKLDKFTVDDYLNYTPNGVDPSASKKFMAIDKDRADLTIKHSLNEKQEKADKSNSFMSVRSGILGDHPAIPIPTYAISHRNTLNDIFSASKPITKEQSERISNALQESGIASEIDKLGKNWKTLPKSLQQKVDNIANSIIGSAPAKQAMDLTPETAKKVKKAITGVKGGKVTKGTAPSNRNRQPAKISTPLGEFSNPVKSLTIPNYPLGGNKRGEMKFWVESHPTKGERIVKQSTGKPSYSTYAKKYAIVTGDDGRTYFLSTNFYSPYPTIHKTDFKHPQDYTKLIEDKALQPSLTKFIESAK